MYHPLCLVKGEKQEENLVLAKLGKVIPYNLKDKALKVLCDFNSWRSLLVFKCGTFWSFVICS